MRKPPSSYEMLVSFSDGQLDADDRELVLTLLDMDADLNREVWELRKIKDMVELSYQEPPRAEPGRVAERKSGGMRSWQWATAMSVAALTFVVYLLITGSGALSLKGWSSATDAQPMPALAETRILLHVTRYSRDIAEQLLDEVEYLLEANKVADRPLRIEVVANGPGLDLLRAGRTHFPERIRRLHDEYGNVTFAACRNTIDRLRRETGIAIDLVPEAVIVNSGVAEAIQRQRQGWAYIDV